VDVTVATPNRTSAVSAHARFSFGPPTITSLAPAAGPVSGATSVTVSGTGFEPGTGTTTFKFGSTVATGVECSTNTSCNVVAPGRPAGAVDVRATVNHQSNPESPADQFTYG
jgi:hypothetical protein